MNQLNHRAGISTGIGSVNNDVVNTIARYSTLADYINMDPRFEWDGDRDDEELLLYHVSTVELDGLVLHIEGMSDNMVNFTLGCDKSKSVPREEFLAIIAQKATYATCFRGTSKPMSDDCTMQVLIAEILRFVRANKDSTFDDMIPTGIAPSMIPCGRVSDIISCKGPVRIPLCAVKTDDFTLARDFSADIADISRRIVWHQLETGAFAICGRDVFSIYEFIRIRFDVKLLDGHGHPRGERLHRVIVYECYSEDYNRNMITTRKAVNISAINLAQHDIDEITNAILGRNDDDAITSAIVDQIQRVLTHPNAWMLFATCNPAQPNVLADSCAMHIADVLGPRALIPIVSDGIQ